MNGKEKTDPEELIRRQKLLKKENMFIAFWIPIVQ